MKWLIGEGGQLEKYNVGTGATRTSTYAEITNEASKFPLLIDTRGKLSMAPCGDMSYRLLTDTNIGNLRITEQVYAEMDDVADGKLDAATGLARIQALVKADIDMMLKNSKVMREELNIVAPSALPAETYTGLWNGKQVTFKRVWSGRRFTDEECEKLCAGEEIEIDGVKAKSGNTYSAIGKLSEQTFNGRKFIGFERTGFGGGGLKGLPAAWCGHKFTAAEKKALESGKPVTVSDAVSKRTGKKFTCVLTYAEKDDGSGEKALVPSFK